MQTYDVAIFGGGIIGVSIFNNLCLIGKKCVLIELNDLASGASKANSAIIHAGFDAMPNTLKAKYNVLGSKLYKDICSRLGVPYKQIGAYVLGDNLETVKTLYERGKKNGLLQDDLEILQRDELLKRIPNLTDKVSCGLFAKNSAITNPYLLTICLAEEAVVNGGRCETFFKTEKIIKENKLFCIYGNGQKIYAKNIVNASGFGYNDIAKMLGCEQYDIKFRRGEYYVLDHSEKDIVSSTIFPLPSIKGKGVLITPTVDQNILVGPTADDGNYSTKTTADGLNFIKQKSDNLIVGLNLKKTIREFAGCRTIVGNDFIVEKSKVDSNVINIAGICSPGLSSAPAIALEVAKLLGYENKIVNTLKIKPYILAKDLKKEEYDKLVKQNPAYGRVICKCEMITEGDIISALSRPIKVVTIDGIKRRVRAGMGRCQGGFCMDKVAKIIAKQNNMSVYDVLKEYPNSQLYIGEIKEKNCDWCYCNWWWSCWNGGKP